MGERGIDSGRYSSIILYSILAWTIICFLGTWFVILSYGIFLKGLIATVMTFFFAIAIWAVPLMAMLISDLFLTPPEKSPPSVMFKDLIRKGMREVREAK